MRKTGNRTYVTTSKTEAAGVLGMGCGVLFLWAAFLALKIAIIVGVIVFVLDWLGVIAL